MPTNNMPFHTSFVFIMPNMSYFILPYNRMPATPIMFTLSNRNEMPYTFLSCPVLSYAGMFTVYMPSFGVNFSSYRYVKFLNLKNRIVG
jgi:hypothetical protein